MLPLSFSAVLARVSSETRHDTRHRLCMATSDLPPSLVRSAALDDLTATIRGRTMPWEVACAPAGHPALPSPTVLRVHPGVSASILDNRGRFGLPEEP